MTATVMPVATGCCAMRPSEPTSVWAWRASQVFTPPPSDPPAAGGSGCAGRRSAGRRIAADDPAVPEHDAPGGEPLDQVHIVGRDHHGDADVVEALEELHDLDGEVRIQVAGGLVGDEQHRLCDDGAGDSDALLLAGRELERPALLLAQEPHLIERRAHPLVDLAPRNARDDERQRDVLGHGTIVQELVILEHHADALAEARNAAGSHGGGVLIVDEYLAARRPLDERDQLQDAALAGARVAGQKRELPGLDLQRYPGERFATVGIALVHLVEADHVPPAALPAPVPAPASAGAGLQQRGHELRRVEHPEILRVLAHAHESDGDIQSSERSPAPRRPWRCRRAW